MNIMRILGGGGSAPGSGPDWEHQHHSFDMDSSPFRGGLCSRFLYTFCSSIGTCVYFISCCWLLQDCLGGPRDYYDPGPGPPPPPAPRHSSELWGPAAAPAPPHPPFEMPQPPGYPAPPGPPGGPFY